MDMTFISAIVLTVLIFGFLATGVWVSVTLLAVGMLMMGIFTSAPTGSLIASTLWDNSWGWALTSLPLFVWMGEILFRSNLSSDMFRGLSPWSGACPAACCMSTSWDVACWRPSPGPRPSLAPPSAG